MRLALLAGVGGAALLVAATMMPGAGAAVQRATAVQTFAVVADTYSSAENQTSTHGSLTYMKVEGAATTERTSYVRFVVSGTSGTVTRATLRVNTLTSSTTGFDVRAVADNTWSEATLAYGNAPPPSPTVAATSGPFAAGVWLSLDVSSLVGGDGTYSFAFTTTG